ncbi:putative vesicle-associated membrane protein 726, partial [Mucuna pruriens]
MGQQTLIYSFVARGTVVLAEYTEFSGNFTTIASQCLQKLPSSNNRFTYNCDGHTFNYLVENGFSKSCPFGIFTILGDYMLDNHNMNYFLAYCVVAIESAGRQIPIAFLERVKDEFSKKYAGGKAATASAKGLNKEFGPKLKQQMQYCVDHPEEINKLAKVKAQVLDRGEKIEMLVDKTDNLRSQAQDFRTQGTKVKRKMWVQNMKMKLIVFGIAIALVLIMFMSICRGFSCLD